MRGSGSPPPLATVRVVERGFDNRRSGALRRADERIVAVLRSTPIFAALPADAVRDLAAAARVRTVRTGAAVVQDGGADEGVFVISAGRFVVVAGGEVCDELGPGDHFGEVGWLYGTERTASVEAVADGEVVCLSGEQLDELVRHYPTARVAITAEASRRYGDTARRLP